MQSICSFQDYILIDFLTADTLWLVDLKLRRLACPAYWEKYYMWISRRLFIWNGLPLISSVSWEYYTSRDENWHILSQMIALSCKITVVFKFYPCIFVVFIESLHVMVLDIDT